MKNVEKKSENISFCQFSETTSLNTASAIGFSIRPQPLFAGAQTRKLRWLRLKAVRNIATRTRKQRKVKVVKIRARNHLVMCSK